MIDLDERLKRGPLRVRSSWSAEQTRSLGREVLMLRRRRFVTRAAFYAASAAAVLVVTLGLRHSQVVSLQPSMPAALDKTESAQLVSSTVVSGSARFDVVPNHSRTFEVHAGDVTVRVLGTAFVVERSGNGAHVMVERGRVRVSWSGGETELGEGGDFPPSTVASPEPEPSAVPVESLPVIPHVWRVFARRGQYAQAFAALRQTPNDVEDTPQDLLL